MNMLTTTDYDTIDYISTAKNLAILQDKNEFPHKLRQ